MEFSTNFGTAQNSCTLNRANGAWAPSTRITPPRNLLRIEVGSCPVSHRLLARLLLEWMRLSEAVHFPVMRARQFGAFQDGHEREKLSRGTGGRADQC